MNDTLINTLSRLGEHNGPALLVLLGLLLLALLLARLSTSGWAKSMRWLFPLLLLGLAAAGAVYLGAPRMPGEAEGAVTATPAATPAAPRGYTIDLPVKQSAALDKQLTPGSKVLLYASAQWFVDAQGRPVRDEAVAELIEKSDFPVEATFVSVAEDGGAKHVIVSLDRKSDVALLTSIVSAADIHLVMAQVPTATPGS